MFKNVIKIIIYFFAVLPLAISPSVVEAQSMKKEEWHDYTSSKSFGLKMDDVKVTDTIFRLEVSEYPSRVIDISGGTNGFIHILEFDKNQKIVTVYNPNKKGATGFSNLDIGFSKFKEICELNNIYSDIYSRIKFLKKRRFGIVKVDAVGFYIVYINIKKSKISQFNHSINSLKL